ncbi:MAG TPA: CPBP family intramembrane glutamic endopeptidase [Rhodanobacter sp.]|nr:CPBP family intramembrane glutamic endopeptidase [Rhodanobacter sp.]
MLQRRGIGLRIHSTSLTSEPVTIDTLAPPSTIPPLPQMSPAPTRAPGVWTALGWVALYFALQAVGSGMIVVVMAVAAGAFHSLADLARAGEIIHAMLNRPGMQALLVILALTLAASMIVLLLHRRWPQLWSLARPPGFGFVRPARASFLLLAVVIGLAAPIVGGWLTQWLAHGHPVTQDIRQLGESTPLGWRIPLVLVVVTMGPLVEELLFRGVLLSALLQRWGKLAAIGLSSLAFALAHLPGLDWHAFALPDLLLLALALAWLRLRSESIWPGVIAHGANNLLAVAAWFIAARPGG